MINEWSTFDRWTNRIYFEPINKTIPDEKKVKSSPSKQKRNKEEGISDSYDLFEQQVLFCFAYFFFLDTQVKEITHIYFEMTMLWW